jgi:hypothetical protein
VYEPPAEQAAALEGGVTVDEYNAAAEKTIACVEAAGAQVRTTVAADGRLTFEYGGVATRDELASLRDAYEDCYAQHLVDLDREWANQKATVGSGDASRLPPDFWDKQIAVVECWIAAGIIPPEPNLTAARAMEIIEHVVASNSSTEMSRCASEVLGDD